MSKCKSYSVYVYTSCLNALYCEQLLIQNDFIVPSHIDHGCKALKHKSNVHLLSTTFLCTCKSSYFYPKQPVVFSLRICCNLGKFQGQFRKAATPHLKNPHTGRAQVQLLAAPLCHALQQASETKSRGNQPP